MLEGRTQTLEFRYNPAKTEEELVEALSSEINESFARPIVKLMSCTSLSYLY
jgi:hypothetical protein